MNTSDYVAIGSLIISIIAVCYTHLTNTKKYELTSQYRSELMNWFSETVEILIKLKLNAKSNLENLELKNELLSRLSAKIEIGRFYFPNVDKNDGFGKEKQKANRGYRNLTLDFLVFSYQIFEKNDAKKYLSHAESLQKHYTNELFDILNPKEFLKETKKHTNKTFSKELRFEDFIEKEPKALEYYM